MEIENEALTAEATAPEEEKTEEQTEKRGQTPEENAVFRRMRLRAEREAQAELRERTQRQEEAARRNFLDNDVVDFMARHPEMDGAGLAALETNPDFRKFCGSRFGREPLSTLYDDYQALVGAAGSAALARSGSRRARATGGGSGGSDALSPAQLASLDVWNAEHPEMAMTAKEFLKR